MISQIDVLPSRKLIDSAIDSAACGETRRYLETSARSVHQRVNETTLRQSFTEFVRNALEPTAQTQAYQCLKDLNGYYRTRYALERLPGMVDIAMRTVQCQDWWRFSPPELFTCTEEEVAGLAELVAESLKNMASAGLTQPYSLLTKWLHFCFPKSFVIFDAQAAASIQSWCYFTFPLSTPAWSRFTIGATSRGASGGYHGFLDFYRFLWWHAGEEQRIGLTKAAQALSQVIKAPIHESGLIDLHIWYASGDPRKLGLL
ncbi:MAG: hypothetical protein IT210_03925 [Armatimonadetes bacterium]|nr:hypothetical protein [Armatimonadota bacterium]